jgi:hypothetical protein
MFLSKSQTTFPPGPAFIETDFFLFSFGLVSADCSVGVTFSIVVAGAGTFGQIVVHWQKWQE